MSSGRSRGSCNRHSGSPQRRVKRPAPAGRPSPAARLGRASRDVAAKDGAAKHPLGLPSGLGPRLAIEHDDVVDQAPARIGRLRAADLGSSGGGCGHAEGCHGGGKDECPEHGPLQFDLRFRRPCWLRHGSKSSRSIDDTPPLRTMCDDHHQRLGHPIRGRPERGCTRPRHRKTVIAPAHTLTAKFESRLLSQPGFTGTRHYRVCVVVLICSVSCGSRGMVPRNVGGARDSVQNRACHDNRP